MDRGRLQSYTRCGETIIDFPLMVGMLKGHTGSFGR
jgi:hypothetical protein